MIVSDLHRLLLYIAMAVLPIWIDFFKLSTDYTFRGLMMPILSSLNAAVVVALAKTSTKRDAPMEPVEVVAPPGKPLEVTETPETKT